LDKYFAPFIRYNELTSSFYLKRFISIKGVSTLVKKVSYLFFAIVVAFSLTLVGCTQETQTFDSTTIRIMTWHFGEESSFGKGYREIAAAYEKKHPEVNIEFVEQPLDGYMEKLNANLELDSDTAIDIAQLQPWMIDEVKNNEKLMDLRDALSAKSAYASSKTWYDSFVGGEDAFSYAKGSNKFGQVLFAPMDANPEYFVAQPIIYNKDLFADAGIKGDPQEWSWSEFIANAEKIQAWGKDNVSPDFTALGSNAEHYGWVMALIWGQFGADLFDDKFAEVDFSAEGADLDPNADYVSGDSVLWAKMSYAITHGWLDYQGEMKAYYDDLFGLYKNLHGLYQTGFEQQSPAESSQLFFTGQVAMIQAHISDKANIENNAAGQFEIGVFLPPLLEKKDTPFATGKFPRADGKYKDGFGVNAKKVAGNESRKQVVVDFLQYMTSKEAQANYVETANSFSPTEGVKNPESLMEWVYPVDLKKTSNEIYGGTILEWAGGSWPGYVQEYIQGKKTIEEMITATSKDAKKNVVDWYSGEPDGIQGQIDAKMEIYNSTTDEDLKAILSNDINTMKIAKTLYKQAVEAGK
jgi:ABC-type glycerol-3-phosphate transport system substrate-binding protein